MTVDIGAVGAGSRCRDHLETLGRMDDVAVTAISDVDEARARQAAEPFDSTVYDDHRTLLENESIDGLLVCLPPFVHTDQELLAANHGIDLFVEPPIGLSLERVREVAAAIDRNGVSAQVGYQRRYADAMREVASLLDGRTIGMIDGFCSSDVLDFDWWRERDKSGGQVVEQVTHIYDAVRYLGGEVDEVSAYGTARLVDAVDFEDVVTASMRHENGVVSHVASTAASSRKRTEIEIIAEDAHLTLRGNRFSGHVDDEVIEYEGPNDPSVEQLESFVASVREQDGSSIDATYSDAVKTLEVTLSVNESITRGTPVAVGR